MTERTLIEATPELVVANGAAFLDSHPKVPTHWRTLIDGERLDVRDTKRCPLGQLARHLTGVEMEPASCECCSEGDFGDAYDALLSDDYDGSVVNYAGNSLGWVPSHGFCSLWMRRDDTMGAYSEHEKVNAAWRAELAKSDSK